MQVSEVRLNLLQTDNAVKAIGSFSLDGAFAVRGVRVMEDKNVNDEGEEFNLIDQLDSGLYTDTGILHLEAAREFIDIIEITFDQLQERQKPILAMLITSKLRQDVCHPINIFHLLQSI